MLNSRSFSMLIIAGFFSHNILAAQGDVVLNEIAWMGTTNSAHDEWIELHNTTNQAINLAGWTLITSDQSPSISLVGTIPAGGYFLLERTDNNTVPGFAADQIYSGALQNTGQTLELRDASNALVDSVNGWFAGDTPTRATMERTSPRITSWNTSTASYQVGLGTPKSINSQTVVPTTSERLNQVSDQVGAINVYFNKSALPTYATSGNSANYHVNLEQRLIKRINEATHTIDVATYEINLPGIVDALIDRAAAGVEIRVLADAKAADDPDHIMRYDTMRL